MKFTYAADARPVDGFTIRRGIHRGGFGEVYYAVSDAGKEVALKLLTHDLDTELRGIRQCLNLKHPNLITLFDVKTDDDGDQWVVMEYVNGSNLEEVLTAFPSGLPMSEVKDWLSGLVNGVEYLHDRGLIHRDLKPANIYRENGVVKIGDVGLSKRIDGNHRNQHTESIGTVYYMAPEITHGKYGPQVDVYSLGIILYEMLTGRLPFNGETSGEILMKQLSAAPDLSVVPPHLKPLLARALEKDPTKRTPSARQLWTDFEQASSATAIPDTHFVNGTRRETAKRDTDRLRETSRTAGHMPQVKTPQPSPVRPPQVQRRNFRELKFGATALAVVLLFIPWQSMSMGDRYATLLMSFVIVGGVTFAFWLREQAQPDGERSWKLPLSSRLQLSFRSNPAGTLAMASLAAMAFTVLPLLALPGILNMTGWARPAPFAPLLFRSEAIVFLSAVSILGVWTVLIGGWIVETFSWALRHPRWTYAGLGMALAAAVFSLQEFLMLPATGLAPQPGEGRAIFSHIGANPLMQGASPTWFGYAVFFGGIFFLSAKRWGCLQDPHRNERWRLWPVIAAAGIAWLWMCLFVFPQWLGLLWAAEITASVQFAAPWQPAAASQARR